MKRSASPLFWALSAGAGILLAFTLGRCSRSHRPGDRPDEAGHDPREPAGTRMYTCSMHPQVRSPDPAAKCPSCGMDLIPVPEDDDPVVAGEAPRLRLTDRAIALMQVQVRPAEHRMVSAPVRLAGRIEPDETRLRAITARAPGRIETLHGAATGQAVAEGEPLVTMFSPMLAAAQQELLSVADSARRAPGPSASAILAMARERLEQLGLSAEQVRSIESGGRAEDRVVLAAPSGGVVIERMVAEGDYVQTGQPLFRLADLSTLWVQFDAYERDLAWLAEGQEAEFTVEAYPGETFRGTVAFIAPVVDAGTRTARVRVEAPNPDGRLKPGMFARAVVPSVLEGEPLVVPATAPLYTGHRAVVYVQIPDAERPTFEAREIVTGPRAGPWQVVQSGLQAGDLVVVHGAFKIDSELQIRGRASMMTPEGGAAPAHDHGSAPAPRVRTAPDSSSHGPATHRPPSGETLETPAAFQAAVGEVIQANFRLVAALAADDLEASRQAGAEALARVRKVPGEGLSTVARAVWTAPARTMDEALDQFAAEGDLDGMRRAFEPFSDALTVAVRRFGTGGVGPVHRAVCPMVQDRKGFWLQPGKDIRNPYWGAAMLECGWIEETLGETP